MHCCNGKTSSTRIRRRTCHSQIETYDDFNSEDAFGRVVFNFKPREDLVWISRSWEICCGRRTIRETWRPSPPGYSKEDYDQSWSSQEWKSGAATHDRSGKPEKTSWEKMQQVAPHREEPLLDGNAHSVRYREMIHDGSGQLDGANY